MARRTPPICRRCGRRRCLAGAVACARCLAGRSPGARHLYRAVPALHPLAMLERRRQLRAELDRLADAP